MSYAQEPSGKSSELPLLRRAKTILRISYTIPFVLASVTGVAFGLTKVDHLLLGALIVVDVFFLALFANLSNDYFDHKSGADKNRFTSGNPEIWQEARKIMGERMYWEGNAFDLGFISERSGKILLACIAGAAVGIGVPIIMLGGWVVIPLGLIALALSFFYTAPPLNLGARGLGEIDVMASFVCMSYFSYFVVHQVLSLEMLLIALAVGLSVMMMRLVDQTNGYDAHVAAGEKDLSVRLGLEGVVRLVSVLLFVYFVIVGLLLLFSLAYLVLFLNLVPASRIVKMLGNKTDAFRFIRPVPQTLALAIGGEVLVIIALTGRSVLTSLL